LNKLAKGRRRIAVDTRIYRENCDKNSTKI
jgi:hypothetical protein